MTRLIPTHVAQAFPNARPLSAEEKSRYDNDVVARFSTEKAIEVLGRESTLFKTLLLNEEGIVTGDLSELDLLSRIDPSQITRHCLNVSEVILRGNEESYAPNRQIAKDLVEMVGAYSFKQPLILKGLEVKESEDEAYAQYGLRLILGKNSEVIEAPDFAYKYNKRIFESINQDYSIRWAEEGESGRTLHARHNGVSRMGLYTSFLSSLWFNLAGVNGGGSVVVVDAGGVTNL